MFALAHLEVKTVQLDLSEMMHEPEWNPARSSRARVGLFQG